MQKKKHGGGWRFVSKESKSKGGKKAAITKRQEREIALTTLPWNEFIKKYSSSNGILRERILREQNGKCIQCDIDEWMGVKLTLHLHHKDGNKKNVARENLDCRCPNCHSITDNYGFKGRKHTEEAKKKFLKSRRG